MSLVLYLKFERIVCECYAHLWRSEDSSRELVLSFRYVDSEDQTEVMRFEGK